MQGKGVQTLKFGKLGVVRKWRDIIPDGGCTAVSPSVKVHFTSQLDWARGCPAGW